MVVKDLIIVKTMLPKIQMKGCLNFFHQRLINVDKMTYMLKLLIRFIMR